ncbi:hypothetical protein Ade02nite_74050 [Paractinoplanes deccanensis]|uniref:DUF4435 domain-containing protein n=1 Tax=Paractinoplanes deccanensis TaxID=113561 RepID=A0ABQ3YFI1_9ACTN|nr:hypothetical protein Ade02nite_74050 [Actinoplanes deccanensis]
MQGNLTGDDLYALLVLMRTSDSRAFLILEGESDVSALNGHINFDECQPIPGYGKPAVLKAMRIVEQQNMRSVAALVDRDWAGFLEEISQIQSVFYTDGFDLDSTIMAMKSVRDRVIINFSNAQRMSAYLERTNISDVIDVVVASAIVVSAVRYLCETGKIVGSAKDFPIDVVMNLDGGGVDELRTLELAMRKAGQTSPRAELALKDLSDVLNGLPAKVECCNGHDLARGLAQLMHKRLGSSALGGDLVERAMRSALGCHDLQSTQLFADLLNWGLTENRNIWTCPRQRTAAP